MQKIVLPKQKPGLLTTCPCCGMRCVEAHSKYTDRCVECGRRYSRFANYKWKAKQGNDKAQRALDEVILEYRMLKQAGYKVPKDIN